MKQQFLKEKTGTIRLTAYENNRPLIPADSVKITLYKPDGATLQAQASASRDATTGEMTYSITATHTATKDLNYKATWEYTISGETRYEDQLFDVVLSILSIPITDDDLYNELNSLRKTQIQDTSTATAGAAGTLTDTAQRKEADDYWNGGTIEIIGGTGPNQMRDITDFVQSTGVISVTPNWATNPDNTSRYRIIRSWSKQITQSFEKIETMLLNKGKRHSLILESSEIKVPLIYLTVHFICLDLMDEPDDKWHMLGNRYWELFNDAFNGMRLQYDEDESGFIQGDEEGYGAAQIRIGRA